MSESRGPVTEAVGRFETRAAFEDAVKALTEAGFGHADLSVLDSHELLDAAGKEGDAWRETLASLTGEVNFIGPIAAAGLIAIATGPVGAAVALAAGAGLSGLAARDVLERIQATPHTEAFARALEAGAVLLWIRAETPEAQASATAILEAAGAEDVHLHSRPQ
ncbi:hypothetical protein ABWI00_17115 [Algihabitans albus]|uniref:hypothetical protein n=1 Tax=Algihabitans albus TaxID=2164067 RepID=UPI0035D0F54F